MSGDNKSKNSIFRRNLDTFKLLVTYVEFQDAINQLAVAQHQLESNEIDFNDYVHILSDLNTTIIKKFNLPYNFRTALSVYLQTGKIREIDIPNRNYEFTFRPRPKIRRDGKPTEPVWEIRLVTYTKLTDDEIERALKTLKKHQDLFFPKTKLFKRTKAHKNLDQELEIEKRGAKRKRSIITEEYSDHWLYLQKKMFDRGETTKKEFNRIRVLNIRNIKKIKEKGYSSIDIARELKVSKHTVEQTIKRLKNERHERFVGLG